MNLHLAPLKLTIATILIFCIFLPFSSCTKYQDDQGNTVNTYNMTPEQVEGLNLTKVKKHNYILKEFTISDPYDWMMAACFFWALPIIALGFYMRQPAMKAALWISEPLFALAACYLIFGNSLFGPEVGSFLSFCSNFTLLFIWLMEAFIRLVVFVKHKQGDRIKPVH